MHCCPRGIPKRYTQEIYFALQDVWSIPLVLRGYISWITYVSLLGIIVIPLGLHVATQEVWKSCYPRGIHVTQDLCSYLLGYTLHISWVYFSYLLGIQSYLLGNVYALQEVYILQNYCTPRHIPKRLTCCPRHMRVLSKTYEPIRRAFFTIPLGVHFIPLAGVDLVQASWVTCYMSWVTCTYLLGIRLRVHLIALGSQSCVHTSWVTYTSWGAASQEV